jgi:hypothetical protein
LRRCRVEVLTLETAARSALFALAVVLANLCGAQLADAAVPLAEITLTPDGDYWRASYRLPQPAHELHFAREDREGNRTRDWTPGDAALELLQRDGVEVVRRKDGGEFSAAEFRMLPRYRTLEKDYAPFSPFGDGGLLIHSGRFHACPRRCDDLEGAAAWRMRVVAPAGTHVIVHGHIDSAADFLDSDSGINIYVGRAQPVDTAEVVAVVDQTFPEVAREKLQSLFPQLMAHYREQLGALPRKPMLFASSDADHPGAGHGYQGGTLPDQVFVHLYGRNDRFEHADFAQQMAWFFAHEAAHLYQRLNQPRGDGDAWIHEGGADAMAAIALRALGVITPATVRERLDSNIKACADGLAGHPLNRSHEGGRFGNFYNCGMLLQMLIDADVRRRSGGTCDLYCVWREFHARITHGDAWNTDTFLAAAAAHADARTIARVGAAVREVDKDVAGNLRAALVEVGLLQARSAAALP